MESGTKSQIDARPSDVQLGLQQLSEKYVPILLSSFSSWREKLSHWFLTPTPSYTDMYPPKGQVS